MITKCLRVVYHVLWASYARLTYDGFLYMMNIAGVVFAVIDLFLWGLRNRPLYLLNSPEEDRGIMTCAIRIIDENKNKV
jgi:hypothetical protein